MLNYLRNKSIVIVNNNMSASSKRARGRSSTNLFWFKTCVKKFDQVSVIKHDEHGKNLCIFSIHFVVSFYLEYEIFANKNIQCSMWHWIFLLANISYSR